MGRTSGTVLLRSIGCTDAILELRHRCNIVRVVARSPDQATAFDRRSPRPTFPGDLRSRRVARSGDRATTANGGGRKPPENIRAPGNGMRTEVGERPASAGW